MENSRNNSHILNCMPFFFFLSFFFFLIWTTFKVFIDFVTILFLFYDFSIFATGMWDLSFLTRDRTHTPCIGRQSLTGHLCVAFVWHLENVLKVLVAQQCPTLQFHGLQPTRVLCPWDSPGKNTGVGCCSLLQGIFLTKGLNSDLLHFRQILYHLSYQGSHSEQHDKILYHPNPLCSRSPPTDNVCF